MPRTKAMPRGLRVWKDDRADAPEWTLTGKELRESWRTCPYSSEKKMSAPGAPDRVPHAPWPTIHAVANHVVMCMGLYFDGTGGAFAHFLDREVLPIVEA